MNRNEVFRIIGYHGVYDQEVKKKLRKLLKKYHPDNNGNSENFKLINEIKKELETKKNVSKTPITKVYKKKDDYDYLGKMHELKVKNDNLHSKLLEKKELRKKYKEEYRKLYNESLDNQNELCHCVDKINNIKRQGVSVFVLIILSIVSLTLFLLLKNIFLLIIMSMILIYSFITYINRYINIENLNKESKKIAKRNIKVLKELNNCSFLIQKINEEINDIEKKIVNNDNDMRFYNNELKKYY